MISLVRELLALIGGFAAVGIPIGFLIVPEPIGLWKRALLCCAVSIPTFAVLGSIVLETDSSHVLRAFLVALITISVAALVRVGFSRATAREWLERVRAVPTRRWVTGAGMLMLAAALLYICVLGPQGITQISGRLREAIGFYHWGLIIAVGSQGNVPPTLMEWNAPRTFPYEYMGSILHGFSVSEIAGSASVQFSEKYRLALICSAAIGLTALWNRFMDKWFAFAAALVTLSTTRFDSRISVYKPEMVSVVLVIWGSWLFAEALERRSAKWFALSGLTLGTGIVAHPVGSIIAAPLIIGLLVAHLFSRDRSSERHAPFVRTGGNFKAWLARTFAAVEPRGLLVFLILAVSVVAAIQIGYGRTEQDLAQPGRTDGTDLTKVLYGLAYDERPDTPALRGSDDVPTFATCEECFGYRETTQPFPNGSATPARVLRVPSGGNFGWVVPFLVAILLIVVAGQLVSRRKVGPQSRTPQGLAFSGTYLLILAATVVAICLYYETWIPERVGPARLAPYWELLAGGAAGGLAALSASALSARIGRVWATALPIAAILVLFTPGLDLGTRGGIGSAPTKYLVNQRFPSNAGHAAIKWIRTNTSKNAVILINGHTVGSTGALTGRRGLLDGRMPSVQPDPWRSTAVRELRRARLFFLTGERRYLNPDVDVVIVFDQDTIGLDRSRFPVEADLSKLPFLERELTRPRVVIYKVVEEPSPKGGK